MKKVIKFESKHKKMWIIKFESYKIIVMENCNNKFSDSMLKCGKSTNELYNLHK